jgi:transaldolase
MSKNPLNHIQSYRQSIWLDNITRSMITTGDLKKWIGEGLMGMTSNPTIFEKAISGSADYDEQMESLIAQGKNPAEILDALMIRDIQMAADLFRPVFESSDGRDGRVSIEINPSLADQTEETIRTVKAVHRAVDRPNVMIKVPSTPEGIPAVEALIGEGISINVTLIFSIETYDRVARAYIAGLQRLREKGRPMGSVRSVASVFVSRVDTLTDKKLEALLQTETDPSRKAKIGSLIGKVAVANAKMIYQRYKEIFGGKAFESLAGAGAHVQRPLWGSTGTKNPKYSDVLYVEELIGEETVNTIPSQTLAAFVDHGKVRNSLEEDLKTARDILKRLSEVGIDIGGVCGELQKQGVKAFIDSYNQLIDRIAAKRDEMLSRGKGR